MTITEEPPVIAEPVIAIEVTVEEKPPEICCLIKPKCSKTAEYALIVDRTCVHISIRLPVCGEHKISAENKELSCVKCGTVVIIQSIWRIR